MGAPRTDLVSTLPTESLKVALKFVKGEHVSARDMAVAGENIFSYAANEFLPEDDPVPLFATRGAIHATQSASQGDIEAALTRVMSAPPRKAEAARKKGTPEAAAAEPAQAGAPPQNAATLAAAEAQSRIDWKTIIQTLLPFILGLL